MKKTTNKKSVKTSKQPELTAVSLFSGAGGMDIGFKESFNIVFANDFDKDACETYKRNIGKHIVCGDIEKVIHKLPSFDDLDLVFGGPPCQGFSVAGKMNPSDPRSRLVMDFTDVVGKLRPKAFVMENVKALGELKKWEPLRKKLIDIFRGHGYSTGYAVLNASDFGVPQARERVFFVGFKGDPSLELNVQEMMKAYMKKSPTVRKALAKLDKPGKGNNAEVCNARVTLAGSPIMRKSPYAGMLFNGLGRPVKLDGYCATLPATMGGNKTPIIDEDALYLKKPNWVEGYHADLIAGKINPVYQEAPPRLRRLTIREAAALQTFPSEYDFAGSRSSVYKQIGNAVPCSLASAVASMVREYIEVNFFKVASDTDEEKEVLKRAG